MLPDIQNPDHIADSENSQNYKYLGHFFDRKELSDRAGNRRNRTLCTLNIFSGDFWLCFTRFATSYYYYMMSQNA